MPPQGWLCREDALPGSSEQALSPALVERPAVGEWLEREVQALLLEEDVALVSSHLLGTVRALAPAPARSGSTARGRQVARQGTQPLTRQQVGAVRPAVPVWCLCMYQCPLRSHPKLSKLFFLRIHSGWRR